MYIALPSDRRRLAIPAVIFALVFSSVLYYSISASHIPLARPRKAHTDGKCVGPSSQASRAVRGIPGFTVFEHVWFHDNSFYFFTDDGTRIPDKERVVHGPVGFEVGPWNETIPADKAKCMGGATCELGGPLHWQDR
ncbi:hypothetical protein BCR39DRAFT_39540 [Naematelia encephala]|uniref:Uncharacterized protein n=1 Tax=Naematelia encephala TaxID=71784 RepID=A0A1Y2BMC4_9TREE|nr:hypothetical protein BCR39DRAFT_39540 [Naematelia encephala]